jgi:hypothetical protein
MPLATWRLTGERPVIEIQLVSAQGDGRITRKLLADTGGGTRKSDFELVLSEQDCQSCGGIQSHTVNLRGSIQGTYSLYVVRVEISRLSFDHRIPVIAVPVSIPDLDGIACFRFLNRFTYGNFGRVDQFGLET